MKCGISVTTLALFLAAGSASPLLAQDEKAKQDQKQKQDDRRLGAERAMPASADFRTAQWLKGRDIISTTGENIGDLSDMLVDRGSGRIEYAVIKTGTVLGLGGKVIAIPYSAMQWNEGKDKFVLNASEDQLKKYPEFTMERWTVTTDSKEVREEKHEVRREAKPEEQNRDKPPAADTNRDRDGQVKKIPPGQDHVMSDQVWNPSATDPYAQTMDTSTKTRIEGEVTSVERFRGASGEETIVTVKSSDGATKRVSLGPSWYVGGGGMSPSRGDKVVIETYPVRSQPDMYTAVRVQSDGRDLTLRGPDNTAVWTTREIKSGTRVYGTHQWRYILASDLKGMKVDCRGEECGKVEQAIVERNSGTVAFLSIDPNKNFLGIADTKRLVPWSVAHLSMEKVVRLDADKDMILAAPETPSDTTTLGTGNRAAMVYRAFKVNQPDFDSKPELTALPRTQIRDKEFWGAQGQLAASIDESSVRTINGKVVEVTTVDCGKSGQSAKAIKFRTADNREETVVLGPAWYIDAQPDSYRPGDPLTLEVCKVTIDGKQMWITRSLERNGRRTAMWENDRPVWDR